MSSELSERDTRFAEARRRLPAPGRPGEHVSYTELATLVNAQLHADGVTTYDVTGHYLAKLERGIHHWPSPARRTALRKVLGADTDADLGFYPRHTSTQRSITLLAQELLHARHGDASGQIPDVSIESAAPGLDQVGRTMSGALTTPGSARAGQIQSQAAVDMPQLVTQPDSPYVEVEPPTDRSTAEDDDTMRRRTLLAGLVGSVIASLHAATPERDPSEVAELTAVRGADLGAPTLDDLDRLAAIARDSRRYTDATLVAYLGECLTRSAADDGLRGARYALPEVLGIAAVVGHAARQARSNVRRPLLAVGARAAEFAGWLYRDCGQPIAADYWRDRASEWAMESADFAMPGYVLIKKSQAAWDSRDAARMLGLAQAVQVGPWRLPARVMAEAVQQEARGLAMHNVRRTEVDDTLKRASELLDASAQEQTQLAAHYDAALFQLQKAICYDESGRPDEAVEIYEATLTPDVFSARDIVYFSALKAQTLVAANRLDEAATTGAAALGGAFATGSARTLHELARLGRRLGPWRSRPTVGDFLRLLQAA